MPDGLISNMSDFAQAQIKAAKDVSLSLVRSNKQNGREFTISIATGITDAVSGHIEDQCGPVAAAEFYYRIADEIVARNHGRLPRYEP